MSKKLKILFLIPVYNDWESLNVLLKNINYFISKIKRSAEILIINDFSSEKIKINFTYLNKINSITVINLKKNIGSQKAIFVALKYIQNLKNNYTITIMDSDGEDDPSKVSKLIKLAEKKINHIVVANRSKRKERYFLRFLNQLRLFFTFLLTNKYMNFGNFSSFHSKNLKNILSNNNLWLAYSGGIKKNITNIMSVNIDKSDRYYGHSKVNFKFLILHSLKIISLFRKQILIKSIVLYALIYFFFLENQSTLSLFAFTLFVFNLFNFIFFHFHSLKKNVFNSIRSIKKIKNNC